MTRNYNFPTDNKNDHDKGNVDETEEYDREKNSSQELVLSISKGYESFAEKCEEEVVTMMLAVFSVANILLIDSAFLKDGKIVAWKLRDRSLAKAPSRQTFKLNSVHLISFLVWRMPLK